MYDILVLHKFLKTFSVLDILEHENKNMQNFTNTVHVALDLSLYIEPSKRNMSNKNSLNAYIEL